MAGYTTANGVSMWYDDRGEGDPVVLLHGGLTDSRDFSGSLDALAGQFRLLLPERRGHGHTPDVPGPITVEVMAQDTTAFVDEVTGGPVRLAGYSAGATVALRVAARRPDLVDKLVLISCAFDPDGMIVRPSADGPPPAPLAAAYAEVSPDGAAHFPAVIAKIAKAAAADRLQPADLKRVTCPVLVVAADDDIVTLEHTLELYRNLPDAQLAIIPGTSHLLLHEKPQLCTRLVTEFLTAGPAATWMPIRRAAPPAGAGAFAGPTSATGQRDRAPRGLPAGLAQPAQRALAAAGYTSLEQLAQVTEADLGRMHGMGAKAIRLLREALAAAGLSFAAKN
jgi:pimeloyl-ACP methyl ester carboxylesterase